MSEKKPPLQSRDHGFETLADIDSGTINLP